MIYYPKFIFNRINKNITNKKELKTLINTLYQVEIDKLSFNKTICNKCLRKGDFEIKGYYYRNIIINNEKIKIRILRIRCKSCGKSHAIFTADFIPYFQLTTLCATQLYNNNFKSNLYDYDFLYRLKGRFNYFHIILKSISLTIYDNILSIIIKSISKLYNSFLQIHRGICILI